MRKILAFLPNTLTLCNVLCGAIGLIVLFSATENAYLYAGLAIFVAAVFDVLDGFVARLLKSTSSIGKELDSLCDAISFGLLPSVLAFRMLSSVEVSATCFEPIAACFAFLSLAMLVASVYRLAKFNVSSEQEHDFLGLPTPANAIFWAALAIYLQSHQDLLLEAGSVYLCIGLALVLLFSILMLSPLRMFSFKIEDKSIRGAKWIYLYLLVVLTLVCVYGILAVSLAMLLYPLFSILHYGSNRCGSNKKVQQKKI